MTETRETKIAPEAIISPEARLMRAWRTVNLLYPSETYRPERQAILVRFLADRPEFAKNNDFRPHSAAWALIRRLYDGSIRPNNAEKRLNSLSANKKQLISRYIGDAVNTNLLMLSQTEPVVVDTGYGKIKVAYQKASWEGISGITFSFLEDGITVPGYIIRGNPLACKQGLRFDIRTIQPWVDEQDPSIKGLKGLKNSSGVEYDQIIHERTRLVDRFDRNILSHRGNRVPIEDAILLMGLCFLQKNGFNYFCGISQSQYPYRKREELCLNYDRLFGSYFEHRTTDQYAYTLSCDNSLCYVPHANTLPDRLRAILAGIYYTKAENRPDVHRGG